MRQSVIRVNGDTMCRSTLDGQEHAVIVLCTSINELSQTPNLLCGGRILQRELPPNLSIVGCRTGRTGRDLERYGLAVDEAITSGVPDSRNVYGLIQWVGSLNVSDLRSQIANR